MSELVTIRTFGLSGEYEMVKSYLESLEIECFGQDEFSNQTNITNLNGGIKLQVRPEQAEQAVKLLIDGGYLKKEDFEPSAEMKWAEKIINYFKKD